MQFVDRVRKRGAARISWAVLATLAAGSGCGPQSAAPVNGDGEGRLNVGVSALSPDVSIGRICYDLEVVNGADAVVTPPTRICATADGAAAGATLDFVGTCDAVENPNRVRISVASLADVDGNAILDFQDPCAGGACERTFGCVENADTRVDVDLTIMRPLGAGFVDVSVQVDELFCSAKADCAGPPLVAPAPGGHYVGGGQSLVLGMACAGPGNAAPAILRSDIELVCGGRRVAVDPTATGAAPAPFSEQAAFVGEALVPRPSAFWNVALGLDPAALPPDCHLEAQAAVAVRADSLPGGPLVAPPAGAPTITLSWPLTDAAGAFVCQNAGLGDASGVFSVGETPDGAPDMHSTQGAAQLPPSTLTVDATVQPRAPWVPGLDQLSFPRQAERVVDAHGVGSDFVVGEVMVMTDDPSLLSPFMDTHTGYILATSPAQDVGGVHIPAQHVVTFDPDTMDLAAAAGALDGLVPGVRGDLRVTSNRGLATLLAAAQLARAGLQVSIQFLADNLGATERSMTDGTAGLIPNFYLDSFAGGRFDRNPFNWPALRRGGVQDTGAAEAWRALEILGGPVSRPLLAIIDGGFTNGNDLPAGVTAINLTDAASALDTPSRMGCGASPCPWHGTEVAQVAGALTDDGVGTAGVGAPAADLLYIAVGRDMFSTIRGYLSAAEHNARIVNTSFSARIPAALSFTVVPLNLLTAAMERNGMLLFAAAGNEGADVDARDSFLFVSWESAWHYPCENAGVRCIGGEDSITDRRHPHSNYGAETVHLFAPYEVLLGSTPDRADNGAHYATGTSFSSPFVAGAAALIWGAAPELTDDQVYGLLLNSGHASADPSVQRRVDVFAAVHAALGNADLPPMAQILNPAAPTAVNYGGLPLALTADYADLEDADAALTVSWTYRLASDVIELPIEGANGRNAAFSPPSADPYVIILRVTDTANHTTMDTVRITGLEAPPSVTIDSPAGGSALLTGVPFGVSASVTDVNQLNGFDCNFVTWRIDGDPRAATATGCNAMLTASIEGLTTISVTAVDDYGMASSASVPVSFGPAPVAGPPLVSILSPAEFDLLMWHDTVRAQASAFSPANTPIVAWSWTLHSSNGLFPDAVLGNRDTLDFVPGDYVQGLCGERPAVLRATATDQNGESGGAEIAVRISLGPC